MGLSPASILYADSTNQIAVVNDGGNYKLSHVTKVLDSSGTQINPATEGTLTDIDRVLDSIKDTDGIKKITDALPAGSNLIGRMHIRNPGDTVNLGDNTNPVRIDPTGTTTQPMSAASLPLPAGAATEATLSTADTKLGTIDGVLDSIKDTDGIKKITDPLPAGDNNIGNIDVVSSVLPTGAATETTLSGVKTNQESVVDSGNSSTSQLSASGTFVGTGVDCLGYTTVAVTVHSDKSSSSDGMKFQFSIDNSNWDYGYVYTLNIDYAETRQFQFPVLARYFRVNYTNNDTDATTEFRVQTLLQRHDMTVLPEDESHIGRRLMVVEDDQVPNLWRLAISGKVAVQIPPPPEGGVAKTIAADTPLEVLGTETTQYVITTGKTFHIQQIVAGAEGDPTEKGSKVEVHFWDGSVEKLVDRLYVTGFTEFGNYPDTATARDGTALAGDGTNEVRVKRIRMSGSSQEIDAVVRGYEA